MTPPDALRDAAHKLERARESRSTDEVRRLLSEVSATLKACAHEIDQQLSPDIDRIGGMLRRNVTKVRT